jgi:hypothetical protein
MENPNYRREDAKLKTLSDEDHDFLWLERWKDGVEGKTNKTLAKIRMEIPLRYGFTVSMDTVSRFFEWLAYKRECAADKAAAEQSKEEWLVKHPEATREELMEVGDIQFLSRAIRRGDDEAHVRLTRSITARMKVAADKEKAADARLNKVEAGLDALYQEIQGNPAALKAYAQMKEALKR